MKSTDHLTRDCPACRAKIGEKCKDYRGKGKIPCKARLSPAQHRARAARFAKKQQDKQEEAYPLFAGTDALPPAMTAEEAFWRGRRKWALAAEERMGHISRDGVHGINLLGDLYTLGIELHARRLMSPEDYRAAHAKIHGTWHSATYWPGAWRRVLTGERFELEYERNPGWPECKPLIRCTRWLEHQYMTPEAFEALFPHPLFRPVEAPDDGGLAAHLDTVFADIRRQRTT